MGSLHSFQTIKKLLAIVAIAWLFGVGARPASAAMYYLNASNTFPGTETNYAQVDVLESGGNLSFTVTALNPDNWRFTSFFFNLGAGVGDVNIAGLPSGWIEQTTSQNVSEFGWFSDGENTNGNSNWISLLSFTVDGSAALALADLIPNTNGWMFAAHMACGGAGIDCDGFDTTSHFVAGPSPVPLPAAAWLFGSALIGFMFVSNRRKV